ncbi:hypothetical protein NM688_g1416 [Phlebia brevispora]|uniref:Uncharacterized protein n=1 Tax=Phlebia brevispora TaxID=194682 RepID=A0ACC1TBU9_9APHY|nr:hypothetical protein NM688_g1416 [Phlebia brevispora]
MSLNDHQHELSVHNNPLYLPDMLMDCDAVLPPHSQQLHIEEIPDEDAPRYALPCPAELYAGAIYSSAKTVFEKICNDQVLRGAEVWGPFCNDEEWQLVKWLIKNVEHNQAEEFLKLGLIQKAKLGFLNEEKLYKTVDELPKGFT